jgi:hypothetical protein
MAKRHATPYVNNNALNVVNSCAFETVDFKFLRVRNPVAELLVLVGLLVKLKPLEMGKQDFRTGLDLDFFGCNLLGETFFAVQLVRFV